MNRKCQGSFYTKLQDPLSFCHTSHSRQIGHLATAYSLFSCLWCDYCERLDQQMKLNKRLDQQMKLSKRGQNCLFLNVSSKTTAVSAEEKPPQSIQPVSSHQPCAALQSHFSSRVAGPTAGVFTAFSLLRGEVQQLHRDRRGFGEEGQLKVFRRSPRFARKFTNQRSDGQKSHAGACCISQFCV